MTETYFRAGSSIYPLSRVLSINISQLQDLRVIVKIDTGYVEMTGPDAIEFVLLTKPSALEGRRLRWVRHAWAVHNLIGHPGMQILFWLGKPKWGLWLHDQTTPRPCLASKPPV